MSWTGTCLGRVSDGDVSRMCLGRGRVSDVSRRDAGCATPSIRRGVCDTRGVTRSVWQTLRILRSLGVWQILWHTRPTLRPPRRPYVDRAPDRTFGCCCPRTSHRVGLKDRESSIRSTLHRHDYAHPARMPGTTPRLTIVWQHCRTRYSSRGLLAIRSQTCSAKALLILF